MTRTQHLLGAHMSIAGGYYKAVEAAARLGMSTCQIFTKNNTQWRAKPLTDEDTQRFRDTLADLKISHPIAHASYLINLASPEDTLWRRSIEALAEELQRADALGLDYLVTHPGSFTTSSEDAGLKRVIEALNAVHSLTRMIKTRCLIENTAGQGSNLGWRFEHLEFILDGVKHPGRLGACIDTCHAFAAGYPLGTEVEYRATMKRLNATVGIERVKAFHLNDSKRELGSRVDRHAKIGAGCLGLEPFRRLLNDRRLKKTPMYLETPKGLENGVELDVINLATLRGLVA